MRAIVIVLVTVFGLTSIHVASKPSNAAALSGTPKHHVAAKYPFGEVSVGPQKTVTAQSSAIGALAGFVASYARTVTSPIVTIGHRMTDVALLERTVAAPVTIDILGYHSPTWQVERRIQLPRYEVFLGPGHVAATSKNPMTWLKIFNLGPTRPAFAFYELGASAWFGLVIGQPRGHWEIVPFQGSDKGLDYPEFFSPQDVTTASNNCVPDCASGTFTWRRFRFDPTTASFTQVGPVRTSRPYLPYPQP